LRRRSLATRSSHLAEETVVLAAAASELGALHLAINSFWARVDQVAPRPLDTVWRLELTTAIAEIGTNIILYAYPHGMGAVGCIELRLRLYADRIEARLTDQGVAYQPEAAQSIPHDDLFALREGGFGLVIVRAAVDRLAYRRTPAGTNCWRLTKRFGRRQDDKMTR
jgi:anti-sigma regulatory factor (Ser/Thr protein kinase)